jgi:hypothetical protein
MNQHKEQFLNLKTVPGRLNVEETAWYLGFSPHEIPILSAAGLLKPLGHPAVSGTKFFATAAIDDLRRDPKWLARASDAIVEYWKGKNARKRVARESEDHVPPTRDALRSLPNSQARSARLAKASE